MRKFLQSHLNLVDSCAMVKTDSNLAFKLGIFHQQLLRIGFNALLINVNLFSFKGNATRLSNIMRDQLVSGKDTAVYWVEHVIRHNGTKHLKLASQGMPFYQYFMLDVMLLLAVVCLVVCLVVTIVLIYSLVILKRTVKRLVWGAPESVTTHLKSQ